MSALTLVACSAGVARAEVTTYIDLIPVAISLIPDSGRFVQLYGEVAVGPRLSIIGIAAGGYADRAKLSDGGNRYDLLGVGLGAGARYYLWDPFVTPRAGLFLQASLNAGPIRLREQQDGAVVSSGLAPLVSTWGLVGFALRHGSWAGFIAVGPDVTIVPIKPETGAFSEAMVDMFKLDGGVKPTAELAIGFTF